MAFKPNPATALEQVWRTHSQQILRVTQRITNNREDAEDALQDSFLRAHVHLHNFDGRSSMATWLTRIAINSALMILRRRNGAPQVFSLDDRADSPATPYALDPIDRSSSPEAQYAEIEQQSIVREAIGSLRPSIRRAMELQTIEERSVIEVAEQMGLSITATKSRMFQAKKALRATLERKVSRRARATRLQLSLA